MKWLLIVVGILVCLILVIVVIGYLLPVKHSASMRVAMNASPDSVWSKLIDFRNFPQWRKDIVKIEVVADSEWVEVDRRGNRLPMRMMVKSPGRELVNEINGKNLPFGGNWEFRLESEGTGTALTITENGEVYNPVFRFISKFFMEQTASMKKFSGYLQAVL